MRCAVSGIGIAWKVGLSMGQSIVQVAWAEIFFSWERYHTSTAVSDKTSPRGRTKRIEDGKWKMEDGPEPGWKEIGAVGASGGRAFGRGAWSVGVWERRRRARSQMAEKQASRMVTPAGSCQVLTAETPLCEATDTRKKVRTMLNRKAKANPPATNPMRRRGLRR